MDEFVNFVEEQRMTKVFGSQGDILEIWRTLLKSIMMISFLDNTGSQNMLS